MRSKSRLVCITGTSPFENIWISGVTDYGANIEPILQLTQYAWSHVDNGDFIGLLTRQMICRG